MYSDVQYLTTVNGVLDCYFYKPKQLQLLANFGSGAVTKILT
jgi:hypothetical protein